MPMDSELEFQFLIGSLGAGRGTFQIRRLYGFQFLIGSLGAEAPFEGRYST